MKTKLLHPDVVPVIKRKFPGKDIAFAPSSHGTFWSLSVVVKDEPGHTPLPHQIVHGSADIMHQHAEHLNDRYLHLTKDQAAAYIASSMKGTRWRMEHDESRPLTPWAHGTDGEGGGGLDLQVRRII